MSAMMSLLLGAALSSHALTEVTTDMLHAARRRARSISARRRGFRRVPAGAFRLSAISKDGFWDDYVVQQLIAMAAMAGGCRWRERGRDHQRTAAARSGDLAMTMPTVYRIRLLPPVWRYCCRPTFSPATM